MFSFDGPSPEGLSKLYLIYYIDDLPAGSSAS